MPTYGSATVFQTKTASGPDAEAGRLTSSSLGRLATSAGRSAGLGMKATRASIKARTPMPVVAALQNTGTMALLAMPARRPRVISSAVSASPSRYFMINSSSPSADASISWVRAASTSDSMADGMSDAVAPSPRYAFMAIRSTTPRNSEPSPMGSCKGTMTPLNVSRKLPSTRWNCAFSRSILLIRIARGNERSSRWPQPNSVPTSTPETGSTSTRPASATDTAPRVSPTKSMKPGVSRIFSLCPLNSEGITDAATEILRRIASSSQSPTVVPSSTRPRRLSTPVLNNIASARVVLPELPCPISTMLRSMSVEK